MVFETALSPKQLAVLVVVMGAVAFAYQAYRLNEFRAGIYRKPVPGAETTGADRSKQDASKALEQLRRLHIMGNPANKPAQPVVQQPVVDTSLKLELVGTIRDEPKDSALIQAKGQPAKRYYVGDRIDGSNAVLDSVSDESVILKRGTSLETLRYSKIILPSGPSQTPAQANRRGVANRAAVNRAAAERDAESSGKKLSLRERLKRKGKSKQ